MPKKILPHNHGEQIDHLIQYIPNCDELNVVANLFKEMGDSTRIRIFWILCHCEECVMNLSALMDMSAPAVSHHLAKLKNSGLIVSRREGKEVYYKAADTETVELLHHMVESMTMIACPQNTPFFHKNRTDNRASAPGNEE